jgi:hypothetical protein
MMKGKNSVNTRSSGSNSAAVALSAAPDSNGGLYRVVERNKENSFLDVDWIIEELIKVGSSIIVNGIRKGSEGELSKVDSEGSSSSGSNSSCDSGGGGGSVNSAKKGRGASSRYATKV